MEAKFTNQCTFILLMSLFSRFGTLTEDDTEGLGTDERAFSRDTLLHDV